MASTSYSGATPRSSSDSQEHNFQRRKLVNTCAVCHGSIEVGVGVRVSGDLHKLVHTYCKDSLRAVYRPLPKAIDSIVTPGNIAYYVPDKEPYIPPLIIACISEVESRGIKSHFLYRVNGDLAKAKALVRGYRMHKTVPYLRGLDIHTVTSVLKMFLASLSEPLITDELRDRFVRASLISDKNRKDAALSEAISRLPYPNLHTLSYLVRHLRTISKISRSNNVNRLAEVFGPIVIGGNSRYLFTPPLFIIGREDQEEVFKSILQMSRFYDNVLSFKSQEWGLSSW
ncbi:rac GTPase-activating protein 1-like [Venturia canescens]|uniref:rac GTPase-activating protein 1-like n=1 Tax=Venturia canescens TaxID=32260 RepID=UPI001C9C4229|nr:rac GTPase-activating protein 1-like [Venturia canescens]